MVPLVPLVQSQPSQQSGWEDATDATGRRHPDDRAPWEAMAKRPPPPDLARPAAPVNDSIRPDSTQGTPGLKMKKNPKLLQGKF